MHKIFALLLACCAVMPAMADDWYNDDYDMGYSTPARRDNYVGIRLHKNEHIAFKYDITGGATITPKDDNFGFGISVGNRLTDNVKIEFETAYTGAKFTRYGTRHDYDIWSNMLNVYLYQTFGGAVEPYAGLGLGLTGILGDISGAAPHISDSTLDLSLQAMVGVNFALNDRVDLNLGAKYVRYGKLAFENSSGEYATTRIDATEIYIGAAYKFGLK